MDKRSRRRGSSGQVLVVALLWLSSPAVADTVQPMARAATGVVVRKRPSTDSERIGALAPGDSADLIETARGWRKVRLSNATTGFVSSAWTEVLEGKATPARSTPGTRTPTVTASAPSPILHADDAVDWWFVFKFNTRSFPACGDGAQRRCPFGGQVEDYSLGFSQQFVYASSEAPTLQRGRGCVGDTTADPVGATFDEIYNGDFSYVIWNDQFYGDPPIAGCGNSCSSPWGHSKGILAWNNGGEGLVMQVSTPSWPASGSKASPRRTDGNTLGCIDDNDVKVSQHFFALRLTKTDLVKTLWALTNASVVTDPSNPQIVKNGGPADVQALVNGLGTQSHSRTPTNVTLSTGVKLISKPSALHVPPWQIVSAELGGVALRTATWWASPKINSTTASTNIGCWDSSLGTAGPVQIATTGRWGATMFGLKGGSGPDFNHAKIGVATASGAHYTVFGDMNQQGALSGSDHDCGRSQNGRGGMFFVVDDAILRDNVAGLIQGDTAPIEP